MSTLTLPTINERLKDSFIQRVEALEYTNRREPIKLHCLECDFIWESPAASVIYNKNHKCPNCGVSKKTKLICSYCGKEFERHQSQTKKNKSGYFYCSKECGNRHKNQLRAESGEWDNSLNYRLHAMSVLPHKCSVCGWDEDERILEVHHKDEDRSNNKIDNLCILCPTCHRKITLGYYELTLDYKLIKK